MGAPPARRRPPPPPPPPLPMQLVIRPTFYMASDLADAGSCRRVRGFACVALLALGRGSPPSASPRRASVTAVLPGAPVNFEGTASSPLVVDAPKAFQSVSSKKVRADTAVRPTVIYLRRALTLPPSRSPTHHCGAGFSREIRIARRTQLSSRHLCASVPSSAATSTTRWRNLQIKFAAADID